ncbi:MAG: hypothetical protein IKY44_04970 [Clostridia bacterium]|nr:hypothetical protein [Clostridia bacterium]
MKRLVALVLALMLILSLAGCNTQTNVPRDFSFALTWGCYGISSYDSNTGTLIKTTDATNPDDYITHYELTDEDKEYFYNLLVALDVNSYPDIYNPHDCLHITIPPSTLILTVRVNGEVKTITAENIAFAIEADNEKGQKFLSTCEAISNRLKSTDEWKVLPDYEVYYD